MKLLAPHCGPLGRKPADGRFTLCIFAFQINLNKQNPERNAEKHILLSQFLFVLRIYPLCCQPPVLTHMPRDMPTLTSPHHRHIQTHTTHKNKLRHSCTHALAEAHTFPHLFFLPRCGRDHSLPGWSSRYSLHHHSQAGLGTGGAFRKLPRNDSLPEPVPLQLLTFWGSDMRQGKA